MITVDEVRAGLTAGEFFLVYLPTISLADGRCVGAEALIRWRRPSGVVMPDAFIPLIEETPVAGMLTYWVMETVARELSDWLGANDDVHISINVPPALLGRGGLEYAGTITGLSNHRRQIVLEVTERGLPDRLGVAALDEASKLGIRVALDDVTMARGNLAVLLRLNLDIIKLDRSLISQITPESPSPEWLVGLTALLHATPVEVIGEGVENEDQVEALRACGVSMVQGYHFSRPVPVDAFKAYHARTNSQSGQASSSV